MQLIETLINGCLLGGLYGLVGLGLSINFGTMRVVHLAHGDLIVLAAYFLVLVLVPAGIPPLAAAALVVPVMFGVGWALQHLIVQPSLGRRSDPGVGGGVLPPLIVTFGVSMVLQNVLLRYATADARTLQSSLASSGVTLGAITIPTVRLVDFGVGLACLGLLLLGLGRTALGRALRATSDDLDTARLLGIDPRRMYGLAAGISAATGGVAGVLLAATSTFYPSTGSEVLLVAFEVVVVGGLGSLVGTFLGGLLLASAQLLGAHFLGPSYALLTGHIVVLGVLVFRPQGLLPRTAP
ncbi:MAG TPA: branched-chain amino acid ABC transporter permease [Kofleriaceae bacterium]|jgi:branched-chain amino acid transport system permease protein|nr:branched-chain amino acid ABC transporter permease [Kofleriaceae bacterium]